MITIEQRKVRLILFPGAVRTFRRAFAIPEKRSFYICTSVLMCGCMPAQSCFGTGVLV